MIQRRERAGFPFEAGEPVGIGREPGRQNLDRHVAIELRVASPIHLAHSAFADLRANLIVPDSAANHLACSITARIVVA